MFNHKTTQQNHLFFLPWFCMSLLSQFVTEVNLSPSKAHNLKTKSFTDKGTAPFDTTFINTALLKKIGQRFPVDQVDTHTTTHITTIIMIMFVCTKTWRSTSWSKLTVTVHLNLQLVKEQINEHWVIFTKLSTKATCKLGSKIQYFGMLICRFYCKLLYENSLRETGTSVAFWR